MYKTLVKVEEAVSRALLALCAVLVIIASLGRWYGYPIVWSVDIAQLLFVWVCAFGANQAMRDDQHVGVDILLNLVPDRARHWLMAFHFVLIEMFLAAIVFYGIKLTLLNLERQFSDTPLSYGWVTIAIPVCAALLFCTVAIRIFRTIRSGGAE